MQYKKDVPNFWDKINVAGNSTSSTFLILMKIHFHDALMKMAVITIKEYIMTSPEELCFGSK
jgi:hypothetical protein